MDEFEKMTLIESINPEKMKQNNYSLLYFNLFYDKTFRRKQLMTKNI